MSESGSPYSQRAASQRLSHGSGRDEHTGARSDVIALRDEVEGFRLKCKADDVIVASVRDELQILRNQVSKLEKLVPYVDELKAAVSEQIDDRIALQTEHTAMLQRIDSVEMEIIQQSSKQKIQADIHERLNYVEHIVGDTAERNSEELMAVSAKVEGLEAALAKFQAESAADDHRALDDRVQLIERSLQDSIDQQILELDVVRKTAQKNARECAAIRDRLSNVPDASEFQKQLSGCVPHEVLVAHKRAVSELVEDMDKALGEAVDQQMEELQEAKVALEQLHEAQRCLEDEVAGLRTEMAKQASFANDLQTMDLGVAAMEDRNIGNFQDLQQQFDEVTQRLTSMESQMSSIPQLRQTHEKLSMDHESLRKQVNKMDSHTEAVSGVSTRLENTLSRLTKCEMGLLDLKQSKNALAFNNTETMDLKLNDLLSRLGSLESKVVASEDQWKASHAKLCTSHSDLGDRLKAVHDQHRTLQGRFEEHETNAKEIHRQIADVASDRASALERAFESFGRGHQEASEILQSFMAETDERLKGLKEEQVTLASLVDILATDSNGKQTTLTGLEEAVDSFRRVHQNHDKAIEDLKNLCSHHSAMVQRFEEHDIISTCSQFDSLRERMDTYEVQNAAFEELRIAVESLTSMQVALKEEGIGSTCSRLDKLEDRVGTLEGPDLALEDLQRSVGILKDKHEAHVSKVHESISEAAVKGSGLDARLTFLQERLCECERHIASTEVEQKVLSDHRSGVERFQEKMQDRFDELSQSQGRHEAAIESLGKELTKMAAGATDTASSGFSSESFVAMRTDFTALEKKCEHLESKGTEDARSRESLWASCKALELMHLNSVEAHQSLKDAITVKAQDMEELERRQNQLRMEVEGLASGHAVLKDSLDQETIRLEKKLESSFESSIGSSMESSTRALDQLAEQTSGLEKEISQIHSLVSEISLQRTQDVEAIYVKIHTSFEDASEHREGLRENLRALRENMEEAQLASDQAMQSWRSVQEARHNTMRDELKRLEEHSHSRQQDLQTELDKLLQRSRDNRLELEDRLTRNIDNVRQCLVEESQQHASCVDQLREEFKKESYRSQEHGGVVESLSTKIEQVMVKIASHQENVDDLSKLMAPTIESVELMQKHVSTIEDQIGSVEAQLEDVHSRQLAEQSNASQHKLQHEQISAQVSSLIQGVAKCEASLVSTADVTELREQLGLERAQRERLERVVDEQIECEHDMRAQEADKLQQVIDVQRQLLSQGGHNGENDGDQDEVKERITIMEESLGRIEQRLGNNELSVRYEAEQRKKETRRIWEAIDTHTHEVSTTNMMADRENAGPKPGRKARSPQVRPVIERLSKSPTTGYPRRQAEENISADDAYLPFPCQPLTSFLRISGQNAGLSD